MTRAPSRGPASLAGVRVVVLTQFFEPEPAPIPGHVAEGLADRGASVVVLTMQPKYPDGMPYGIEPSPGTMAGRPDVAIRRVRAWRRHPGRGLGRIASYASFAAAVMGERAVLRSADAVYVYGTPMTAALPVWWGARRLPPYLLHVQDLWPESVTGSTMVPTRLQGVVRRLLEPWLRSVYDRAYAVLAIAPTMAERLAGRTSRPEHVHTVLNWADESLGHAPVRSRSARVGALRLLYAGNIGWMQGLDTVMEALRRLPESMDVQLRVIGAGSAAAHVRAHAADLIASGKVVFLPPVPRAELEPHHAWADFSLIPLRDLDVFEGTIPSKVQGSLHAGLPVITTVPGDVRSLVERHGLGLTAPADDPDALAAAFRAAAGVEPAGYSSWSHRVATYYHDNMSKEKGIDRIAELIRDAVRETRTERTEHG